MISEGLSYLGDLDYIPADAVVRNYVSHQMNQSKRSVKLLIVNFSSV